MIRIFQWKEDHHRAITRIRQKIEINPETRFLEESGSLCYVIWLKLKVSGSNPIGHSPKHWALTLSQGYLWPTCQNSLMQWWNQVSKAVLLSVTQSFSWKSQLAGEKKKKVKNCKHQKDLSGKFNNLSEII